ncbi:MAG: hypothetical protein FWG93_04700 [Oscillospiraceae bacterium]|nr:hypothetical protein [Oscillospiraceae bacterium]
MPVKPILKAGAVFAALILAYTAVLAVSVMAGEDGGLSLGAALAAPMAFLAAWAIAALLHKRPAVFTALLAAAAFTAYLAAALWADRWPSSDFEVMYSLALTLRGGGAETVRDSLYILRHPYQSLFVAYQSLIVSPELGRFTSLLIGNAVWMAGIAVLIYRIALWAYSTRTAAFLAALYLLYPAPYLLAPVLTNQHIALFFVLLGIWIFSRKYDGKHGLLAGAALALGNALRPDGILVFAALALLALTAWLTGERALRLPPLAAVAGGWLTGCLLSLLVTLSGISAQGLGDADPLWKLAVGLNLETGGTYSQRLKEEMSAAGDAEARRALEKEVILRNLSAGPGPLLAFWGEKNRYFWGAYEETGWAFREDDDRAVPVTGRPLRETLETLKQTERLMFVPVVLLALLSAALLLPRGRRTEVLPVLCGLFLAVFFCTHLVTEVQTRYRYLVMPFLFWLAGPGLEWLSEFLSPRKPAGACPVPEKPAVDKSSAL